MKKVEIIEALNYLKELTNDTGKGMIEAVKNGINSLDEPIEKPVAAVPEVPKADPEPKPEIKPEAKKKKTILKAPRR